MYFYFCISQIYLNFFSNSICDIPTIYQSYHGVFFKIRGFRRQFQLNSYILSFDVKIIGVFTLLHLLFSSSVSAQDKDTDLKKYSLCSTFGFLISPKLASLLAVPYLLFVLFLNFSSSSLLLSIFSCLGSCDHGSHHRVTVGWICTSKVMEGQSKRHRQKKRKAKKLQKEKEEDSVRRKKQTV